MRRKTIVTLQTEHFKNYMRELIEPHTHNEYI
jgi:hypothetical protein